MQNLFQRFAGNHELDDQKNPFIRSLIKDIGSQLGLKRLESNWELLDALTDAVISGEVDDKQYVQEKIVQLLSSLPSHSQVRDIGTGLFIKRLWEDLDHPPLSSLGEPYRYRTADGSNNNVQIPHLGKAGSYYTRTVTPKHVSTSRPEPGLLFDTLLARKGNPSSHPNKISSLLFALATIIIHDVFRTNDQDQDVVDTSSYLDLSPLYGSSQDTQNTVRTFVDGRLKPDAFAEVRFSSFPPEASVLLLCFNRIHNSIVQQLAIINEGGRFSLPTETPETDTEQYQKAMAQRDNALFQTARLVTSALYVQIILNDYVRTILNLQRVDSTWNLDPREDINKLFGQTNTDKAVGNQVSVEFNLIYRWHSVISVKGENWLNEHMSKLLPNTTLENLTPAQLRDGMRKLVVQSPTDPGKRTFGGLQRNSDGHFEDQDLVTVLTETTEDVAASFGPRHVPVVLKAIEVLGIQQARDWSVASLNETRSYFGLAPYKTFADVNSDPDIAASLEALYGDVDNVELYPGVVVEEPKESMTPGSGLCAGFTTTRAILSDAVALIRGDRFYTVDYTPFHLTAFGHKEASSDATIAGGGVMYKLLMRAFPGWHRGNSIYALYPFTIPSEMRDVQRTLGHEPDFDYGRPKFVKVPTVITDSPTVNSILHDSTSYTVPWSVPMRTLYDYNHVPGNHKKFVNDALVGPENSLKDFSRYMNMATNDLIRGKSHRLRNTYQVDVTRDIAALSWTQFVTCLLHIPARNSQNPDAAFDTRELHDNLFAVFRFIHLDIEPAKSLALKRDALRASQRLTREIGSVCGGLKSPSFAHMFFHSDNMKNDALPYHGTELLKRLFEDGGSTEEVASLVVLLAAEIVITSSSAISQIINLFLDEPYHCTHWPGIQKLANDPAPWTCEALRVYVLEALRLTSCTIPVLRISDTYPSISDWRYTQAIKKGDMLLLDIATVSRDPNRFPKPDEIKLDRSQGAYLPFVDGIYGSLVSDIALAGLVAQLRVFGKMEGLRRAPGGQGRLSSMRKDGMATFLNEAQNEWVPLPTSMKVHFDSLDSLAS